MASSCETGMLELPPEEKAELEAKFTDFVKLATPGKAVDGKVMNSKACGKMVKDTLPIEVRTIADASVFPKHKVKTKGHKNLNMMEVCEFPGFIHDCAWEYAKIKEKNPKLASNDPKVGPYEADFRRRLCKGKPQVTSTKISATGNVAGMTDTQKYTGAHKSRFDEEGKGKGIEGRKEMKDTSGYVGAYKGADTYDKKH